MNAHDAAEHALRTYRPVPDCPGYHVSSCGVVISVRKHGGKHVAKQAPRLRVLTQRAHPRTGHLRVDIRDNFGCRRTVGVHQLVARAWHQTNGDLVRHLDGDPTNNTAGNLRHGTHSENAKDRYMHAEARAFAETNPDIPF